MEVRKEMAKKTYPRKRWKNSEDNFVWNEWKKLKDSHTLLEAARKIAMGLRGRTPAAVNIRIIRLRKNRKGLSTKNVKVDLETAVRELHKSVLEACSQFVSVKNEKMLEDNERLKAKVDELEREVADLKEDKSWIDEERDLFEAFYS